MLSSLNASCGSSMACRAPVMVQSQSVYSQVLTFWSGWSRGCSCPVQKVDVTHSRLMVHALQHKPQCT